jgi:hypothetical protein
MSTNGDGRIYTIDDDGDEGTQIDISSNVLNKKEEEEEAAEGEDEKIKKSYSMGNKIKTLVKMKGEHDILYNRSDDKAHQDSEEIVELIFDNAIEGAEGKTHDEKTGLLSSVDSNGRKR